MLKLAGYDFLHSFSFDLRGYILRMLNDGDNLAAVVICRRMAGGPECFADPTIGQWGGEGYAVQKCRFTLQGLLERLFQPSAPFRPFRKNVEQVLACKLLPPALGNVQIGLVYGDEPEVRIEGHDRGGNSREEFGIVETLGIHACCILRGDSSQTYYDIFAQDCTRISQESRVRANPDSNHC